MQEISEWQRAAFRMRDGLRAERAIYSVMLELSRRQHQILSEGMTEEIVSLASAKEDQLQRIDELEGELTPLKQNWETLRDMIEPALRKEVEGEIDQVRAVLHAVIEMENRGYKKLDTVRTESMTHLKKVEGGRKTVNAYRQHMGGGMPPGRGGIG